MNKRKDLLSDSFNKLDGNGTDDEYQWQEQVLNGLLLGVLGFGVVAVIVGTINQLAAGRGYLVVLYWVFLFWIAVVAFVRRIPYSWRVGGLLAPFFVLAIADLHTVGLAGNSEVYLLSVVVLSALLANAKVGGAVTGLALLAITGSALMILKRWIPLDPVGYGSSLQLISWINYGVGVVLSAVALTVPICYWRMRFRSTTSLAKAQKMRFQTLVESMVDWFWEVDRLYRFTYVSPQASRQFGLATSGLVGSSLLDLFSSEERDRFQEHVLDDYGIPRTVRMFQTNLQTLRDGEVPVEITVSPILGTDGDPVGFRGITRDVRERVESERQLNRSERYYWNVLRTAPDGFVMVDGRGRFLDVNDSYCAMSGYTREELHSMTVADVEAEQTEDEILSNIRRLSSTGVDRFETKHRRKDGSTFDVEITARMDTTSGRVFTFARDISDRKQNEQNLYQYRQKLEDEVRDRTQELERQKLAAERANRAKTEFLSRVSHELRTPLTPIIGFAEILQADSSLDESQRASIGDIAAQARELLDLIDEVLRLADADRGAVQIQMQPTIVSEVVAQAVGLLSGEAERAQVTVSNRVDPSWPREVLADPLGLQEVLVKLISNGIRYNHRGGAVEIDAITVQDGWTRITVTDTGIGLDPTVIKQLFEPFAVASQQNVQQTVQETLTDGDNQVKQGIGAGLAIAKKLVELMGGKIAVETDRDAGSAFWIELPSLTDDSL